MDQHINSGLTCVGSIPHGQYLFPTTAMKIPKLIHNFLWNKQGTISSRCKKSPETFQRRGFRSTSLNAAGRKC